PTAGWESSSAVVTRPSAAARTVAASPAKARCGSRKKRRTRRPAARAATDQAGCPSQRSSAARATKGRTNGQPSRAKVIGAASGRGSRGEASRRDSRLAGEAQDGLHVIFPIELVELDPLLLDLVVLREERFLVDLGQPPLARLVLLVQAAELVVGGDQLLFDLVADGHRLKTSCGCEEGWNGRDRPGPPRADGRS